jgi:CelD/BcsL family acetyltransferase involved in cellulose biosynthesis
MTSTSVPALQVRLIASDNEFAELAAAWEELQRDAAVTSVFETFDWQHLWWRNYGQGRELRLLIASVDGALAGILPLYIETVTIAAPVRQLRFVGTGGDTSPDDLGPVLAKGRETEVARALAEEVLRIPGWDVMLLDDMQPENAFIAAMTETVAAARLNHRAGRSERITYMALPATWDAWLKSLSGDRRYRVRNIRKKVNAAQPTRFVVWQDAATLDEGIATLIRLHIKRWGGTTEHRSFASPAYINFHSSVMTACFKRDRLRLYGLELSGAMVAMFYFYKFRDRVYLMQSGYDPDHSRSKPGLVLLGYIVEHAIGEGHAVLDFLRGDHQYKDELATGERETVYLQAFRPTLGAHLYRTRRIYLPALKARLRKELPALKARLRELVPSQFRPSQPQPSQQPPPSQPPPSDDR